MKHGHEQCEKPDWDMGGATCENEWCRNEARHDWGVMVLCCAHTGLLDRESYIESLKDRTEW